MEKMTIAKIRETIRAASWTRNDLVGGTAEEFRRQAVGPSLRKHIATLQALQIPARFVNDAAHCATEIASCRAVIARWEAVQVVLVRPGIPNVIRGPWTPCGWLRNRNAAIFMAELRAANAPVASREPASVLILPTVGRLAVAS